MSRVCVCVISTFRADGCSLSSQRRPWAALPACLKGEQHGGFGAGTLPTGPYLNYPLAIVWSKICEFWDLLSSAILGSFHPCYPMATESLPMATESLASMWENNNNIRRRARETGSLTTWESPKVVGIPSTKAMTYNREVLETLATWWTAKVDLPQAVPIDTLRKEAWVICSTSYASDFNVGTVVIHPNPVDTV